MIEKRDVLRRLAMGHGIRAIHRDTGLHRTSVRELKELAESQGWLAPGAVLPSEEAIAALLWSAQKEAFGAHWLEAWRPDLKNWVEDKLSFVVIHRRLREKGLAVSEATVRRFIQSHIQQRPPKPKTPRTHEPGKVMEVDFGFLGHTWDPAEERRRKTWVFSGRLRCSRRAWREIVFDQKANTFFACHCHAFEFFGGVPFSVVPDNLKPAVIQASFEDPLVNRGYQLLAEHYGFVINPCLPYRPEHKGGVESDIKYITNNFWKDYVSQQKELGNDTPNAHDLQVALQHWSETVADTREIRGVGSTVNQLFAAEKPFLQKLPLSRWEPVCWARAKVQDTWRIQYRKAYYTVPYRYIGKEVDIMERGKQVAIFFDGLEIARHDRAEKQWTTRESACHQPPQAEAYLEVTRENLLKLANSLGPAVSKVTACLLDRAVVDGLRPARALLALRKQHQAERLESACTIALLYDAPEYQAVRAILERGVFQPPASQVSSPVQYTFARQPEFFAPGGTP